MYPIKLNAKLAALIAGIEHEGWSSDPSWYTSTMYSRSAWLTAYACVNYSFGGCSQYNGVYGHDYAQPGNSDPGGGWNWSWYNQCVGERIELLRTGSWPPGAPCF